MKPHDKPAVCATAQLLMIRTTVLLPCTRELHEVVFLKCGRKIYAERGSTQHDHRTRVVVTANIIPP